MGTSSKDHNLYNAIIQLIEQDKPKNVEQLINHAKTKLPQSEKEITEAILKLQSEGKIKLTKSFSPLPFRSYVMTEHAQWFWITVATSILTTIIVFTIPENAFPWVFIRYLLGTIFVLWFPGYTLVKTLFPTTTNKKEPTKEGLDIVERLALSLGMSLALVPIIGLLLNYTPWGIRLTPIVLSLLGLTLIFATTAIMREHQSRIKAQS